MGYRMPTPPPPTLSQLPQLCLRRGICMSIARKHHRHNASVILMLGADIDAWMNPVTFADKVWQGASRQSRQGLQTLR